MDQAKFDKHTARQTRSLAAFMDDGATAEDLENYAGILMSIAISRAEIDTIWSEVLDVPTAHEIGAGR